MNGYVLLLNKAHASRLEHSEHSVVKLHGFIPPKQPGGRISNKLSQHIISTHTWLGT